MAIKRPVEKRTPRVICKSIHHALTHLQNLHWPECLTNEESQIIYDLKNKIWDIQARLRRDYNLDINNDFRSRKDNG